MELRNLIPWHRDRSAIALRRDVEPLMAINDRMNRMFEDFFRGTGLASVAPFGSASSATALTLPNLDVSETAEEIRIDAELPGVEEKDIQVSLADGVLTLSGEKQAESKTEGKDFHHVERSFGSFRRSVSLPCEVDTAKASATFKNGVLQVRLPKTEPAKEETRTIPIRKET